MCSQHWLDLCFKALIELDLFSLCASAKLYLTKSLEKTRATRAPRDISKFKSTFLWNSIEKNSKGFPFRTQLYHLWRVIDHFKLNTCENCICRDGHQRNHSQGHWEYLHIDIKCIFQMAEEQICISDVCRTSVKTLHVKTQYEPPFSSKYIYLYCCCRAKWWKIY